jgi:hypothetical protein
VELVTCKTKTVKGKKTQTCTTKLVSGTVTLKTAGTFKAATLTRGKLVYATGKGRRTAHTTDLVLTPLRKLARGRYTLKLGSSFHETVVVH